jgi:hypothetical protein
MNLYELSQLQRELYDALTAESPEGEPLSEEEQSRIIDDYLAADVAFTAKVESYCFMIEAFSARAEFLTQQAERHAKLSKQDQSIADRMTARLKAVMIQRGERTLEANTYRPRVINNGGVAPLIYPDAWRTEPAKAPEKYHKKRIELDTTLLREDLKNGEVVEGCKIGERGTRLKLS